MSKCQKRLMYNANIKLFNKFYKLRRAIIEKGFPIDPEFDNRVNITNSNNNNASREKKADENIALRFMEHVHKIYIDMPEDFKKDTGNSYLNCKITLKDEKTGLTPANIQLEKERKKKKVWWKEEEKLFKLKHVSCGEDSKTPGNLSGVEEFEVNIMRARKKINRTGNTEIKIPDIGDDFPMIPINHSLSKNRIPASQINNDDNNNNLDEKEESIRRFEEIPLSTRIEYDVLIKQMYSVADRNIILRQLNPVLRLAEILGASDQENPGVFNDTNDNRSSSANSSTDMKASKHDNELDQIDVVLNERMMKLAESLKAKELNKSSKSNKQSKIK